MTTPVPQVLSWPLGGVDEFGRLNYASDDESVREVIRNILLTRAGERLLRPTFGAGLLNFIHQSNNETTRTRIAILVKKSIEQWETRIVVDDVSVLPDTASVSRVQILIRYRMRYAGQPVQLTFGLDLNSF